MVKDSFTELIGNTPILKLNNFKEKYCLKANVLAKLEYFNPAGSVKDRVANALIKDAEQKGFLNKNSVIIEPTSGNTGIGLAAVAACKGYKIILTMPETMSIERRRLLAAYGAELVLTPGAEGMSGAIKKAQELADSMENSFIPGQFDNPANPNAHYNTTGPEIFEQTNGDVDIFISGVGTGGTITGVGRYLKENKKDVKIIAVEPESSPVLSKGEKGPHKIQGIGAGFVPKVLDTDVYDEVIAVPDDEALKTGSEIVRFEGILVGISSGAALWAAKKVALRPENEGKNIVVLLPDTGERYLSSEMFSTD